MNNCFIQTVAILEDPISQQISTYKNTITLLFVALCCTWSWKNWNWKELKWNAMKFQCNFLSIGIEYVTTCYIFWFWVLEKMWLEGASSKFGTLLECKSPCSYFSRLSLSLQSLANFFFGILHIWYFWWMLVVYCHCNFGIFTSFPLASLAYQPLQSISILHCGKIHLSAAARTSVTDKLSLSV